MLGKRKLFPQNSQAFRRWLPPMLLLLLVLEGLSTTIPVPPLLLLGGLKAELSKALRGSG